MKSRRLLLGGLLWACVAATACGSGGSPGGSSSKSDCTSLATAICDATEQCSPFYLSANYGDMATCVARNVLACQAFTTASGASVKPSDYAACAKGYAQLDCAHLMGALHGTIVPSGCAVPGARANGQPCGVDTQCKSGYCQHTSVTCGTCEDLRASGAPCTQVADCQAGLTCSSAHITCAEPGKVGDACTLSTDCAIGLACAANKCVKPGEAGAPCTLLEDCDVDQGMICGLQHTCMATQLAKIGAACGIVNNALVACEGAGFCDIPQGKTTGTCRAPPKDGGACGPTKLCMLPAMCVSNTCRLPDTTTCG